MARNIFIALLLLFFFITASGNIDSIDATSHMYLAKQIVQKGRIDFGKGPLADKMVAHESSTDGNRYIVYNFGYAFFFIPGVLLSDGIRSALSAPASQFPAQPDYILTWYANMLNGIIITFICLLVYKLLKRLDPKEKNDKWWLLLLSVFATNMVIQGHHQFAHPVFVLFAMLSLWKIWDYALKGQTGDLRLFCLFLTVTASLYNTSFVLLFIPFAMLFISYRLDLKKPYLKELSYVFLSFIPPVVIQLIWNYLRYGSPFLSGYMELGFKVYEFNPIENIKNLLGMTVGPNKGLLFNSPVLILAYIIAIREAFIRKSSLRNFSVFYLLLTFFYLLNYSFATIWHGESTYGPRYLFILVPLGLPFILLFWQKAKKTGKILLMLLIAVGFWVQIPGLLIPHFTFPHISKPYCIQPDYRYFDPRCSPPVVGWAQLLKRETKETPLILRNGPLMTEKYPNPLTPFRTLYPDPLFDRFSNYRTSKFAVKEDLFNCVYAFSLDLWWLKQQYYRNITL